MILPLLLLPEVLIEPELLSLSGQTEPLVPHSLLLLSSPPPPLPLPEELLLPVQLLLQPARPPGPPTNLLLARTVGPGPAVKVGLLVTSRVGASERGGSGREELGPVRGGGDGLCVRAGTQVAAAELGGVTVFLGEVGGRGVVPLKGQISRDTIPASRAGLGNPCTGGRLSGVGAGVVE